jgi:hypothetical protein
MLIVLLNWRALLLLGAKMLCDDPAGLYILYYWRPCDDDVLSVLLVRHRFLESRGSSAIS